VCDKSQEKTLLLNDRAAEVTNGGKLTIKIKERGLADLVVNRLHSNRRTERDLGRGGATSQIRGKHLLLDIGPSIQPQEGPGARGVEKNFLHARRYGWEELRETRAIGGVGTLLTRKRGKKRKKSYAAKEK